MLTKFGVNNTRSQKVSPPVRGPFKKLVVCKYCGCKCEKTCLTEELCDLSVLKCPKCGKEIK